ncbi:phage tail family protein, partial [Enterococcus sp. LJL90]
MQSDVKIKLDEFNLTDYMDLVESPDFGLLPRISHSIKNKKILETKIDDRSYTFHFRLFHDDWIEYRDKLIRPLSDFSLIKKLTISLFSDRYWNVVIDGDTSYTRELENSNEVDVYISFLITDGTAHATTLTPITAKPDENGILSMDINYDGVVDTPLQLKFHNNAETGYLSAIGIHEDQATFLTQLGYMDEADGEVREKMATIFEKDGGKSFANWKDASVFYENQSKKVVTTMSSITDYGGWLGKLPSSFTNNGGGYYGACKELVLPTAAQSCYLWARAWFETGVMGQTGEWCLAYVDETNKFIAGMAIEKNDGVGNSAMVNF